MKDTFTFYAIYCGYRTRKYGGLYWTNLSGYGGRWAARPRLWSRKSDAKQCMNAHKHNDVTWRDAIIIPMEVKPL